MITTKHTINWAKLFLISIALLSFSMISYAQGGDWEKIDFETEGSLADIFFINPQTGWLATSNGTVLKSNDGGLNWEVSRELDSTVVESGLSRIVFLDSLNGWAVGDWGLALHTTDGGATWEEQEIEGSKLTGVCFVDNNIGWVISEYGDILKTTDGGQTWNAQANPDTTDGELLDVAFTSKYNGWICGEGGLLMHTINGGESWELVNSTVDMSLIRLALPDSVRGWAVGSWGVVIHMADGQTWEFQPCGTDNHLRSVCFIDTLNGWAVGKEGTVIYTEDGGETWNRDYYNFSGMLKGVYFVDKDNGWVIGGSLYKYTPVTGVEIRNEVSTIRSLALVQNYPNPVSLSLNSGITTIEFQLTKPEVISIEVFNVLGQRVKTLIADRKYLGGQHSIAWNGLDDNGKLVPTGIYFYRIQTPYVTMSKRLLITR